MSSICELIPPPCAVVLWLVVVVGVEVACLEDSC